MVRVLACRNANVIQNGIRLKKSGMSLLGYFLWLGAAGRPLLISITGYFLPAASGYFLLISMSSHPGLVEVDKEVDKEKDKEVDREADQVTKKLDEH